MKKREKRSEWKDALQINLLEIVNRSRAVFS